MVRILHTWLRAASLILLLFFTAGCGGGTTSAPASACPPAPVGGYHKESIGGGDESSIEVFTGTYAYTDPGGVAWCDVTQLGIQPTSFAGLPPIPTNNNVLAAVDIKPDNVTITQTAGRPQLTYDLSIYTPKIAPETCKGSSCYAFYRYGGSSWIYAGSATAVLTGSKWFAQGLINHFSTYALVELLPPQMLPGPQELGLQVASQFYDDVEGSMSVAFIVNADSLGQFNPGPQELIFRFFGVDLAGFDGAPPEDCLKLGSYPEEFTCLFRIGAQVKLQLGMAQEPNLQFLSNLDGNFQARFYSNPVQVH